MFIVVDIAMTTILSKFAVAIASLTVGMTLVNVNRVQAETITYDVMVNVRQGNWTGRSFQGAFSYDDATLTKRGREELGVEQGLKVCVNLFGRTLRETDDTAYPELPKLRFKNGKIKRLDFWIEAGKRLTWWDLPGWDIQLSRRKPSATKAENSPLTCGQSGSAGIRG